MSIVIHHDVLRGIQHHLETSYPHEACGFILGHEKNGTREVIRQLEVKNVSNENQRRRFIIDPLDYLKVEKTALREGLELLGIYHSHPDHPAIPSIHDLEYAQPYFSYFIHTILSGKLTDTRSYRLSNGHFIPEPFTILRNQDISAPLTGGRG